MVAIVSTLKWPVHPYRGLAFYDARDRLLFGGRGRDVQDCVRLLSQPDTKMLLLHGRTGCGKSSFLRAGVIPELEERGCGFIFLRDFKGNPDAGEPAFIRCGSDPVQAIARQIFEYATHRTFQTELGQRSIDLTAARLGHEELDAFLQDCARDERNLLRSLGKLSGELFYTLLIVVDQAEEVVTLTQGPRDPRRVRFFRFLQAFQAEKLPVLFLFALRTDAFGTFFYSYQLDNSLGTDAKQYVLPEMDQDAVARAIVRPTSRQIVNDFGSAYDQYQFEFETAPEDLACRIARDLFQALPEGGVLPVMQILCRDLFEAASALPQPRIIRRDLYLSQGGVTGCLDRHITRSLSAPITSLRLSTREAEAEERRWRAALYDLVLRQGDGSVRSNTVPEARFLELLGYDESSERYRSILRHLTHPDILVLRWVPSPSPRESVDRMSLALGHDALGLALVAWQVRDQEHHRLRVWRRRTAMFAAVTAAAALAALFTFLSGQRAQQLALEANVSLLESVATREIAREPLVGLHLAVEALYEAMPLLSSFKKSSGPPSAKSTIASFLEAFPDRVQLTDPQNDSRFLMGVFPLASDGRFLHYEIDGTVTITAPLGAAAGRTFRLFPSPGAEGTLQGAFQIHQVRESADGTIVLACEADVAGEAQRCIGVLPVEGSPSVHFEKEFLALADAPPAGARPLGDSFFGNHLWAAPDAAVLAQTSGDDISLVQRFDLNATRTGQASFAPADEPVAIGMHEVVEFAEPDTLVGWRRSAGIRGVPESISALRLAGSASAPPWTFDIRGQTAFARCFDTEDPKPERNAREILRNKLFGCAWDMETRETGFIVMTIDVPMPRNEEKQSQEVRLASSGAREPDGERPPTGLGQTWVVLIETQSGDHRLVNFDSLARQHGPAEAEAASTLARSRLSPVGAADIHVGHTARGTLIVVREGDSARVFRLGEGSVELTKTLYGTEHAEELTLTTDGAHVLAGEGAEGLVWTLLEDQEPRISSLASAPAIELVERACRLGAGKDEIDRNRWFALTGRPDGPRPPRCDDQGKPLAALNF